MGVRIGSNTAALTAQRRLGQSSNELGGVFERLASGQRINRASDDAAGLAIADQLRADRRLWTQSLANINDGISALAITDGALDQRGSILQRLSELAEQSANGTFSGKQRVSIDKEYQQLLRELERIRDSTSFNGLNLFDSTRRIDLQVGIDGTRNSQIGFDGISLGYKQWVINTSTVINLADFDGNGGVDGGDFVAFVEFNNENYVTIDQLQEKFGTNFMMTSVVDQNGVARDVFIGVAAGSGGLAFLSFTANADGTGFTGNSRNYDAFLAASGDGGGTTELPTTNITLSDSLSYSSSGTFTLDFRILSVDDNATIPSTNLYLSGVDTTRRARSALDLLRSELDTLAAQRGRIGATESRLRVALNLAASARENSAAAEGRIRDADIAAESARLVRLQILQQVGATVLQNAATQPQLALRLLQG